MENALEVRSLSFDIHGVPLLQDVSLRVGQGEHLALVGHNGAGKSTFIKCIARIYQRMRGELSVFGRDASAYSLREYATLVSYVPQHFECEFPYSVFEFVLMSRYPMLHPLGRVRREDREKAWHALEATDTAELAKRELSSLSGGERQRVLIAAAIAQEGKLMLLDEPMTGLDPRHQDEIRLLFDTLKRDMKIALVTATHDINVSACMADRIAGLKRGRVVFEGTAAEFMTAEVLAAVYDKQFYLVQHPEHKVGMVLPG